MPLEKLGDADGHAENGVMSGGEREVCDLMNQESKPLMSDV